MIKTTKNVLHPCQCGCETPIIEETVGGLLGYRVVCPQCKNEEEGYFQDSLESAIRSWNGGLWKWDNVNQRKWYDGVDDKIKARLAAACICDIFEELLDRHDITIPDEDRTGSEDESRLYGLTYYNLEKEVTEQLRSLIEQVKANLDAEVEYDNY